MFVFRKTWRALFSWSTRFEICPFALLPMSYVIKCFRKVWMNSSKHTFPIPNSSQFFLRTRKNIVLHHIPVDNHIDNVKSVQIRSFSGMYFPAFSPKLYLETFHAVWNLGKIGYKQNCEKLIQLLWHTNFMFSKHWIEFWQIYDCFYLSYLSFYTLVRLLVVQALQKTTCFEANVIKLGKR